MENERVKVCRRECSFSLKKWPHHIGLLEMYDFAWSWVVSAHTSHGDSEEYINILSNVMLSYVEEIYPGIPYVNFVHDNSRVHRSRVVQA